MALLGASQSPNAEGHVRRFGYAGHRLVQKTFATGTSFYYEYDAQGRCNRTWGDENYYNGAPRAVSGSVYRRAVAWTFIPRGHPTS
ncbi:hypothetical protein [Hymenobacter terrenus]|uniref:hypothetical protein n=1 Tax=Hymenobacter terrenus TaxID=1629124 RepID=UPI0006195C78|nr:hypothetical protein [Hymenobacter terrenus]